MDTSCIQCNMSEDEEDFYETHQWLPDRLWCVNKINKKIPGYKQTPPDWCDDCVAHPGETCPDCGCTHNC